jgi:uncharacterized membrane-anchored protein YhcB (DUF1043 family)
MWNGIFFALIVGTCVGCLIGCLFAARSARAATASVRQNQRSFASKLQLIETSQEELREIVEKIAQSQKMQRVRKATTHASGSSGEPDPRADPEGWRNWKNAQLRAGQFN